MIDLLDLKLKDKFSTTGTTKLTGNIGSKITAVMDFIIHWELIGVDVELVGTTNIINSNDGSDFIQAGFLVGDIIELVGSASNDGEYVITGINQYTLFVANTGSDSMVSVSFTNESSVVVDIHGKTPVDTIDYYHGLVENSASPVYTSLIDGETQHYRKTGLDADGGNNYALDVFTTNKSWVSGSTTEQAATKIYELGIGNSGASYGYEQYFRIEHEFYIEPAVLRAWEDANEDLDITLISFLNLTNSLKFIPRITSGFSASGSEHSTDNGNLSTFIQPGDVGFYGEYRNGGAPNYGIDTAVDYESSGGAQMTELAYNDNCLFEVIVEKLSGNFNTNHKFDLYLYIVPDDADVMNNPNTVWENFNVSNVYLDEGAAPASNNIFSQVTAVSLSGNTVVISAVCNCIPSFAGKKYLIFVDIGEEGSDTSTNDHHTLLIDYNEFALFIDTEELIVTEGALVNEHSTNDTELAFTDFKGWVEDGLVVNFPFNIKKTAGVLDEFTAALQDVTWSIDVEHQTDSSRNFNLEEVTVPLPSNTTRGFQLYTGDPKNDFILNELTGDVNYRYFLLQFATKIRWENWAMQGNADPDFINATANWSTYDLPPDWKIYINIKLNVLLDDGTTEEDFVYTQKINIKVLNYDDFNGCERTGIPETYHGISGQNLNGKLLYDGNTIVKGIFYGKSLFPCIYEALSNSGECEYNPLSSGSGSYSNGDPGLDGCPEYYGILELDRPNVGNALTIRQISTVIVDTESPSPWIGDLATNKAVILMYPYTDPPRIEVIATLDYTQLNTSATYKLSARLGKIAETVCNASIMASIPDRDFITNSAITGFTADDLLMFYNADEITVMGMVLSIIGDIITFTVNLSGNIKIVCSKNTITDTAVSGTYQNAALIGLTLDDFLFFRGDTGDEMTSMSTTTFNSGTGEIQTLGAGIDIKISFHVSFINTFVIAATTYSDNALIGLAETDVIILVNGRERTHQFATISGNTITFPAAVTGTLKVCRVNQ